MKKIVDVATHGFTIFLLSLVCLASLMNRCSKNPGEPVDPTDPCLDCPPVFIEVPGDSVVIEIPVVCSQLDATVEFTVKKDQSQPNDYLIQREGFPDESVSITDISPAPVDTSFTRVFENYTGERFSIKRVAGSRAEAIGVAIIDLRCSE